MILGLRTVTYATPDITAGKEWYSRVVGHAPYFDQDFYVGFNVGGFELGLVPNETPGVGGTVVYWGVADIATETARLQSLGALLQGDIEDVGGEIKVAVFLDPFGNKFGIIYNPHFKVSDVK